MRNVTNQILLATILALVSSGCSSVPSATVTTAAPTQTKVSPTSTPTLIPAGVTITVTSAEDEGAGTLRQALWDAQSGDTITFDDQIFPPGNPITITLSSGLPEISQGDLTIDASDAWVILDGSNISTEDVTGLSIASNGNIVRGLQIINFSGAGIQLQSGSEDNLIGGNQSVGTAPLGQGNLISNNGNVGIGIFNASNNVILGNHIGTDTSGTEAWGNSNEGIYIGGSSNNEISQNLICNNGASGITLQGHNTYSNVVSENLIGVGVDQSSLMGNGSGVEIRHGAHNNQVGPGNTIANMNSYFSGIQIYGSDSIENTITQNSIYDSRWTGIDLWGGGNLELAPPIIINFDINGSIRGLAYPNASVEVFSIDDNNRSVFEGQTDADNTGIFVFEKKGESFTGPHLTVSATDVSGNTSEFSLITDGENGTTSLQNGNPLDPTHLETFMSNELEDNHIGSFWHNLWDYDPLTEILDETRYLGVKRFRFSIAGNEIVNGIVADHDNFVNALEDNGIQLTYVLALYNIAYWRENGIEPLCSRFDTTSADYKEELEYYLKYVKFIVEHFKGRVQYYEIWNEPDNPACYLGIKPDDYITLVKATVSVIQREYPDQEIKIKLGGTTGLSNLESQEYLFYILESDIMPLVDVVSWHPFYGDSPEQNPDYYYAYPDIVQQIKTTASSHGFEGEYEVDEMNWRPHSDPDGEHPTLGEIAYAKYWARGILINLGLDVTAGNLRIPHQYVLASSVVRYLSTIMEGNKPISLPVAIEGNPKNVESYGFSLPNGDNLIALWDDGVAADHDAGLWYTLAIPGFASWNATASDVLNGFEQDLISSSENDNLIIRDISIKDYPIIIRLSK